MQLMEDIEDSIERSTTGYLDTLETIPNLQTNFINAIEQDFSKLKIHY